jgi:hypothetical protein
MARVASLSIVGLALTAALVACGGGGGSSGGSGGGGGGGVVPPVGPTPCPTGYSGTAPNCYAPGTAASVTGSLVDYNSGAALGGVPVSIVALSTPVPYASPSPLVVTTTQPSGQFAFSATPGPYVLIIGSNTANDTRATAHTIVTLAAGPNALHAPGPWTQVLYTSPAVESSGAFRTKLLSSSQQTCLSSVNSVRAGHGAPPLVPDEWMEEDTDDIYGALANAASSAFPIEAFSFSEGGFKTCLALANLFPNDPLSQGPYSIWFGGDERRGTAPGLSILGLTLFQIAVDPRIDVACPTAPPAPLPTPGPTQCNAFYRGFPQEAAWHLGTPAPTPPNPYPAQITLPQPAQPPTNHAMTVSQSTGFRNVAWFDASSNAYIWGSAVGTGNGVNVFKASSAGQWLSTPYSGDFTSGQPTLFCAMTDKHNNLIVGYTTATNGANLALSIGNTTTFAAATSIKAFPVTFNTCPQVDSNNNLFVYSGNDASSEQMIQVNESGQVLSQGPAGLYGSLDPITDVFYIGNGNIQKTSPTGQSLGSLPFPFQVGAFDQNGNLWTMAPGRFDKINLSTGQIVQTVGVNGWDYSADAVLIDSLGDAWLFSPSASIGFTNPYGTVTEVSPSGSILRSFYTTGQGGTNLPSISPAGDLWILNDQPSSGVAPNGATAIVYPGIAPPGGTFSGGTASFFSMCACSAEAVSSPRAALTSSESSATWRTIHGSGVGVMTLQGIAPK